MTVVPLDRRFIVWTDKETGDPEIISYLFASHEALTWEDLLAKHRVVVLAEAGSGKSTELTRQAELGATTGLYTFSATVQNVGRRGMSAALSKAESAKLEEWRTSDQPAWFFLDSVDDAKASDVRLEDALKEIADAIEGAAARAHIILSGRHTNWEFRRDLELLEKWIPMPPADVAALPIDPNELVVSAIRRDKPPEPPPPAETVLVVVMGALNHSQVEAFAQGMGVTDIEGFFSALEKSNLWDFARRPLDLNWLVDFWRIRGALGPLAEMLELSLRERLIEPDLQRARKDPVDVDRAMAALERIGAALVLQGLCDIAVPDSGLDLSDSRPALDLARILPDWSGKHRASLMSRAVFDPASAGLARLHNDNQGSVRSYLTARWFKRLMDANCPRSEVADLLFATTYGVHLVIPSMRQTAAWLSLWNSDIAREVIDRDPRLLMDAGDPASVSLAVREKVLKAVVQQVFESEDFFNILDRDSLIRFASPEMAPCVRDLWAARGGSPAVRRVLLLMIWLGELTSCADLAVAASYGAHTDRYTQIFSGRALMAAAPKSEKRRYAEYVRDHAGTILSVLVWDAVDTLFPAVLSVEDLLMILASVDVTDRSGGLGFDYLGPKLVDRLTSAAEVERLISGVLDRLEAKLYPADEPDVRKDEPFLSTIEAAGRRILELVLPVEAPTAAIDAALRIGDTGRYQPRRRPKDGPVDLFSLLLATPERRRSALWRAAERFAGAKLLQGKPITDIWDIEFLGFPLDLKPEDLDWLIEDAEHRSTPNERQIAASAALRLWRQGGEQPDVLARIRAIGGAHAEVATLIDDWTRPRSPSEKERAHQRKMRHIERRSALKLAERDELWRDFADRLRADPDQLRKIQPPSDEGMDVRLYNLWRLLNAVGENQSRYAVDDLAPLEPMFGPAVVAALREAFLSFWRHWMPKLRSERPAEKRNTISTLDCIGIVGVTLEAAGRPAWAAELSYGDAVRAAIYATLELNGYPSWFVGLAQAQPDAVRDVLQRTVAPELEAGRANGRCEELETISRADVSISSLLADQLFEHLSHNEGLPLAVLTPTQRILRVGYRDPDALISLLRVRFDHAVTMHEEATYLVSLFRLDPAQVVAVLDTKLATLSPTKQTLLVQRVLPGLFGGQWADETVGSGDVPFQSLERLVIIAFRTIRVEDDIDHSGGEVYSPDARDDAESARGALFKALVSTPGLATFDAIHRLMENPEFPIRRKRMLELARERAGSDSEHEAWSSADVCGFESDFLTAPRTPRDLQRLALRKLADLQHDLLNADYAQGATVARLPKEVDVQKWMAERLRRDQGRSYSIEREPHVAEEKEPDIRFRAKASDANVPMEIKVAESWTLEQLADALKEQLVGRYLRDRSNRCGIMLLVHQRPRSRGWKTAVGEWITFDQVVGHLRALARSIAAEGPNVPQPEIAVIDVSTVVTTSSGSGTRRNRKPRPPVGSRGRAV